MNTRPFSLPIWAQALLAGAAFAAYASQAAYADSLEERLRTQLRSTTQQLQVLQTEQAQAAAAKAALAQVKQLSAELTRAKGQAEQLSAQQQGLHDRARQMVEASNEQLGKYKQAYDELLVMARAKEAERQKLDLAFREHDQQLQQCTAKNREMYGVAKEILGAYENVSVAEVMKIRQPFASGARVKFEEMAQKLGDDLYKTQVENRQAALAQ
ncbi:DNA repair protein [Pseudomonas aeruginosa]|nr:DNA repair protein [Pseudomonas aeruginosa]RPW64306.1 DNA repair protein [Pseudomonas aeruginosa]